MDGMFWEMVDSKYRMKLFKVGTEARLDVMVDARCGSQVGWYSNVLDINSHECVGHAG